MSTTLKQSVKSDITVRSEVQNSQVYKLKAGFSYFYFVSIQNLPSCTFFTQSASYTQSANSVCILHPVCSLRSAFYTDRDKTTLCTFWSFVKKLVSYFASIKRDVTILINYENMLQLMTTLLFAKVKKKIAINFRNLVDTAIGLEVLEMVF